MLKRYGMPAFFIIAGLVLIGWWGVNELKTNEAQSPSIMAVSAFPENTSTPQSTATDIAIPTQKPDPIASPLQTASPTASQTPRPTATPKPTSTPEPTRTPQPIIPTLSADLKSATHTPIPTNSTLPTIQPAAQSTNNPIPQSPSPTATPVPVNVGYRWALPRFGVAAAAGDVMPALNAGLPFGSYVNWRIDYGSISPQVSFWQMVRLQQDGLQPNFTWQFIEEIIAVNPRAVWLVGNEMDVKWQDNITPEQYARLYHQVYHFIKDRAPEAKVAIGGVSQPTPLRRAYLDIVLNTYQQEFGQPMPIDIWNVHAFTLREQQGSWGVGIPPGMGSQGAKLYEIEDHRNLEILKQNLFDFRAWMAARGYGNKPLVISEYGILMPAEYGFPPEVVADFMTGTFDFFLTAANGNGYPADGNRLVQSWYWYSVYDPSDFPSGNLWDRETGKLTVVGEAWQKYVNGE